MSMIGKLTGLASIGGALANVALLQQFLAKVSAIIALTIISSLMGGALLIGALYGAYAGLVHYGVAANAAFLTVAFLVLAICAVTGALALYRLQKLRELPRAHFSSHMPVLSRLEGIAGAFLDGLGVGTSASKVRD